MHEHILLNSERISSIYFGLISFFTFFFCGDVIFFGLQIQFQYDDCSQEETTPQGCGSQKNLIKDWEEETQSFTQEQRQCPHSAEAEHNRESAVPWLCGTVQANEC